jgi:hypothetical protein
MVRGEAPPAGARWRAWEEKRRREGIRVLPYSSSWFSLGPANFAGRMLALTFHPTNPNVLYAGAASGGLWKSLDRGVSWTPLTDDGATLAVGGLAVLPSDPNVVIMATGEGTLNVDRVAGVGILKSTDAGASWSQTSLTYAVARGHGFHFVAVNPIRGTLLAGATDGLWRSTDAGDTWTQIRDDGNYYDAKWKPGDVDRVYTVKGGASAGNRVKVSTDDGVTFANVGAGQPSSFSVGKTKLALSPADPSTVYALYTNAASGGLLGLYRSTNDGANWTAGATTPNITGQQGWYNLTLAVDPDDVNRVIAGGVGLYRSTDGGATLNPIGFNVHVDHHDIAYVPGSTSELFVATDGGIWESTNDGNSWTDRNSGLVTYHEQPRGRSGLHHGRHAGSGHGSLVRHDELDRGTRRRRHGLQHQPAQRHDGVRGVAVRPAPEEHERGRELADGHGRDHGPGGLGDAGRPGRHAAEAPVHVDESRDLPDHGHGIVLGERRRAHGDLDLVQSGER